MPLEPFERPFFDPSPSIGRLSAALCDQPPGGSRPPKCSMRLRTSGFKYRLAHPAEQASIRATRRLRVRRSSAQSPAMGRCTSEAARHVVIALWARRLGPRTGPRHAAPPQAPASMACRPSAASSGFRSRCSSTTTDLRTFMPATPREREGPDRYARGDRERSGTPPASLSARLGRASSGGAERELAPRPRR